MKCGCPTLFLCVDAGQQAAAMGVKVSNLKRTELSEAGKHMYMPEACTQMQLKAVSHGVVC
jgi:hypothetical protein